MKVIAILDVIEIPTVCKECRFREGTLQGDDLVWICHLNDEYVELNTKSDYCPLRPLLEEEHEDEVQEDYDTGWLQ